MGTRVTARFTDSIHWGLSEGGHCRPATEDSPLGALRSEWALWSPSINRCLAAACNARLQNWGNQMVNHFHLLDRRLFKIIPQDSFSIKHREEACEPGVKSTRTYNPELQGSKEWRMWGLTRFRRIGLLQSYFPAGEASSSLWMMTGPLGSDRSWKDRGVSRSKSSLV